MPMSAKYQKCIYRIYASRYRSNDMHVVCIYLGKQTIILCDECNAPPAILLNEADYGWSEDCVRGVGTEEVEKTFSVTQLGQ